jgi:hypothetical protein
MRNPIRVAITAVAAVCVIAIWPAAVWAEPLPPGNTIGVSQGTSQGQAGFDPQGIVALANKPGDGLRHSSLPNGASPGGAYQCDSGLAIVVALGCLPQAAGGAPVCPAVGVGVFPIGCLNPAPSSVLVLNPVGTPPATPPVALALQALAQKPWPQLKIGVNPESSGLTGLPSWFWISGDPRVADATASVPGLDVVVHAQLTAAIWNFGDGRQLDSGLDLGQPYPIASTVQHLYETDSGAATGYTVVCVLHYLVSYAVNGGGLQPLGEWLPTYTQSYTVKQLQPQAIPIAQSG